MKKRFIQLSVSLAASFFSFLGLAQSPTEFDGKYVGKFHEGGFEDSLIISNGTLAHIHNAGWGYGVEHQFVYNMISLKGEMVTLEQIHYLKDRKEEDPLSKSGEMHEQTYVFLKDADGNLEMIAPGDLEPMATFKKVD